MLCYLPSLCCVPHLHSCTHMSLDRKQSRPVGISSCRIWRSSNWNRKRMPVRIQRQSGLQYSSWGCTADILCCLRWSWRKRWYEISFLLQTLNYMLSGRFKRQDMQDMRLLSLMSSERGTCFNLLHFVDDLLKICDTTMMPNHPADKKSIFALHDTWSAPEERIGQRTLQGNEYIRNTQVKS